MRKLGKTVVKFAVFATLSILVLSCGPKKEKEQELQNNNVVSIDTVQNVDRSLVGKGRTEVEGETVYEKVDEFARDTIDTDSVLVTMEKMVLDLEAIHIKSLADTIKLVELYDEYDLIMGDAFSMSGDLYEEWAHSKRVRILKSIMGLFTEMKRIGQECSKVGYPGNVWDDELEEVMIAFQEALDRELN